MNLVTSRYVRVFAKWLVIVGSIFGASLLFGNQAPTLVVNPACDAGNLTITQANLQCTFAGLNEWIARFGTWIVLGALSVAFLVDLLGTLWSRLKDQMLTADGNDTPAFMLTGMLLGNALMIFDFVRMPFNLLQTFGVNVAFRMPVYWLLCVIAMIAMIVVFTKIRSVKQLDAQIATSNVNTIGVFAFAAPVIAAFLF